MFTGSNSGYQAPVEDTNEFPGTDLLLEDNFESEIVARRFQEGGLSFNSTVPGSLYEGPHHIIFVLIDILCIENSWMTC